MAVPEHRLTAWDAHRVESARMLMAPSHELGLGYEWASSTASGGTVARAAAQPAIVLAVTGTSGSSARLRSREQHRRTVLGLRSALLLVHADGGQTAQVRRWGRFDDANGVFFELSGTTLRIVRRTSASGSLSDADAIDRVLWNGNKMDGLDLTKLHSFEIEEGRTEIRFWIDETLVHTMAKAGVLTTAIASRHALPLAAEVINTGASTGASMTIVDAELASFGGVDSSIAFGASSGEKALSVGGVALLSLRAAATISSLANRTRILPSCLHVRVSTTASAVRVMLGGTLGGSPSWTAVAGGASHAEVDIAGTTHSDGVLLGEYQCAGDKAFDIGLEDIFATSRRSLVVDPFTDVADVLTVVGIASSGTPSARASLSWMEER